MELSGVTVNADVLGGLSAELATRAGDLASAAYAEIGHEVNLGSPKQLQQVLFEELGHAEDPVDQDRVLDGRRLARRPAGLKPAPVPRPAAASTATRRSSAR